MNYLADCLNMPDIARYFANEAEILKKNNSGTLLGSQGRILLQRRPEFVAGRKTRHRVSATGNPLSARRPTTNLCCLIQRLSVWSGFMSMWAGIATPETSKRDGTTPFPRYPLLQCTGRYPHAFASRKNVRHTRQRQSVIMARSCMDKCQLSRIQRAGTIRVYRGGTRIGRENDSAARTGL